MSNTETRGKLVMGIDWVDNPRPLSLRAQVRVMLRSRFLERQKERETKRRAGCYDAAKLLAAHPSHRADPFAFDRAFNLMVRGILNPEEVIEAKGAISV